MPYSRAPHLMEPDVIDESSIRRDATPNCESSRSRAAWAASGGGLTLAIWMAGARGRVRVGGWA